jgi:hypothetical protein
MTKKEMGRFFALGALTLLVLAGCGVTSQLVVKLNAPPPATLEAKGAAVTIVFLDEQTLISRFGRSDKNPFLTDNETDPGSLLLAFEITVVNKSGKAFVVGSRESDLFIAGGARVGAANRFLLEEYWASFDEDESASAADRDKKISAIRRHAVDTRQTVEQGKTFSGILCFMLPNSGTPFSIPAGGKCTVTIGITNPVDGKVSQRFEFPFDLK